MTQYAILKLLKEDAPLVAIIVDRFSMSYIPQDQPKPSILLNVDDVKRNESKDYINSETLDISIVSIAETISIANDVNNLVYDVLDDFFGIVELDDNTTSININRCYQVSTTHEYDEVIGLTVVVSTYKIYSSINT